MLLVESQEVRYGNAHFVGTPDQIGLLEVVLSLNALCVLVELNSLSDWVGNHSEVFLVFVIAEPLLLHFDVIH